MLCRCESGTSVPREQRFLSGMAFSINEVVRVACQSLSDHTKKGQTNWLFTILNRSGHSMCNANGNKNSILPFAWQTSSVLLKSGRKSLKLALEVKGFSQMEHEFLFGTFRLDRILSWSGRTGLPFQMFCCSRKLSTGTTWKAVLRFCLFNRTFRNL